MSCFKHAREEELIMALLFPVLGYKDQNEADLKIVPLQLIIADSCLWYVWYFKSYRFELVVVVI